MQNGLRTAPLIATDPLLADPELLPRRVLCLVAHPGDEVRACGGLIAFHALRGDALRVLVLSDGSARAESGERAAREAESRAALQALRVEDVHFLALPAAELGPGSADELLAEACESFGPELVYAPAPSDRARASLALALARWARARQGLVLLVYELEDEREGRVLFDTTRLWPSKRAALERLCGARPERLRVAEARDRARALPAGGAPSALAEALLRTSAEELAALARREAPAPTVPERLRHLPRATAVISSFNKREEVRANLAAVLAQSLPFEKVVVVDNASSDGTAEMVRTEFPGVCLVVMPHSRYGACETFNIGFAQAETPLLAILDDDIVMPPDWLEKATLRLAAEPASTAILSTKVVEPGMPDSYRNSPAVNEERYMSTFRGCASLARSAALREAGYYDERLFIYGNERDLTCRLLNLGYRVLQYPGVEVFHRTPFGIKPGKRSLYYHARNAWLTMLKYAPAKDLALLPWLVLRKVVLRSRKEEESGEVAVAVGTIGIGRSLRETPGATWIVLRAALSVLANVPYCLRRRRPVRHQDFDLPLS